MLCECVCWSRNSRKPSRLAMVAAMLWISSLASGRRTRAMHFVRMSWTNWHSATVMMRRRCVHDHSPADAMTRVVALFRMLAANDCRSVAWSVSARNDADATGAIAVADVVYPAKTNSSLRSTVDTERWMAIILWLEHGLVWYLHYGYDYCCCRRSIQNYRNIFVSSFCHSTMSPLKMNGTFFTSFGTFLTTRTRWTVPFHSITTNSPKIRRCARYRFQWATNVKGSFHLGFYTVSSWYWFIAAATVNKCEMVRCFCNRSCSIECINTRKKREGKKRTLN